MKQKETIWTLPFISIFAVNLALQMGQYMTNLLVPKYAAYLGGGAFLMGVVNSAFAVTSLAICPVSGAAMSSLSKKLLMAVTAATIALVFFLYGLSGSIAMLMAVRLLHGIAVGVSAPLALAIAGNCLPEGKMASGVGVFTLGQAVATAIGPNIGLALSRAVGYQMTFISGGCVAALACGLCALLPADRTEGKPPFRISLHNTFSKEVFWPAAMMLCVSVAYSCVNTYVAVYGEARGVANIGLFFTAYAIALLLSRPLSGAVSDRFGYFAAMIPGFALFALAYLVISLSGSLTLFLLAGVLTAFGYGTIQPNIQSLGMRCVPPERRGVAANTTYAGMSIGVLVSGPLSGVICEWAQAGTGDLVAGYAVTFRLMILPVVLGALIFVCYNKSRKKRSRSAGMGSKEAV